MIAFEELGATDAVQAAYDAACKKLGAGAGRRYLGRVVSLDRGFPLVRTAVDEQRAELAASIKKSADSIVAVGDWVVLACPEGHEKAVIEQVLPRRTELARVKRVGRERQPRRQVLAANVDTVFVCHSLTGEGIDCNLLVRQMCAVMGCDVTCVFVFTKSDLVGAHEAAEQVAQVAGFAPDIPVLCLGAGDAEGLDALRTLCPPGSTSLLLGESGVGKSSLVNALTGEDAAAVGEVRESDDKGRHTTVARRMVALSGGGVLIDAPGLRTLQVLDVDASVAAAFPDILDAACDCRFRDCKHEGEPGCAVVGSIPEGRLAAYRYMLESDWRTRS